MALVPYGYENIRQFTDNDEFMTQCMRDGIEGIINFFVKTHENKMNHNIRLIQQNNKLSKHKYQVAVWDGVRWVKMRHDDGMQMLIDDIVEIFEAWFVDKFGSENSPDIQTAESFIMEVVSPSGNFWDVAYFVDPDDARISDQNHPENLLRKAQMTAEMTSALMAIMV